LANDFPMPEEDPVTNAHVAPLYFFFKFCEGMKETTNFGIQ